MSMRPPASRRVRAPALALASPAIVQSGPGGLWILPWCGKRGRCVRRRLNRRRERVYYTTRTAQTPPTEPTGIVVLALVHEITRTTSMIRCDTDATSLRSPLQQHTPFLRGVSFRCRRGVNSGCRLTPVDTGGAIARFRRDERWGVRGVRGVRRAGGAGAAHGHSVFGAGWHARRHGPQPSRATGVARGPAPIRSCAAPAPPMRPGSHCCGSPVPFQSTSRGQSRGVGQAAVISLRARFSRS